MDLTDAQWDAIKGSFPKKELKAPGSMGGRPWRSAREVLDGVLWILRTGAPWAYLPTRYPPYQTCHRRFQRWVKDGVMTRILTQLRKDLCERGGIEDIEGFIDGTYVPAKRGASVSANAEQAMQPRSWLSQTAMVFHSLSLLRTDPDTTVCSPTELSTLLSYKSCRPDS
jgi:transposase